MTLRNFIPSSYDEKKGRVPARGFCVQCGARVWCEAFTNTCDRCGTDYNQSGQMLAPRENWGEETGEHWSECF